MARQYCTQETVARALHLSQAAVSRRLRGTVDFTITELHEIAELLDVDIADLVSPGARSVRSAS